MAEFKLGRIKFVWKGNWASSTIYYVDDVIRFGGKTFICVAGHTSDSDFYTDLNNVPTRWNQMADGLEWKGDWQTSTDYKINDLVKYGGNLYVCNNPHSSASTTSDGLEIDQPKWTIYGEGFDWLGDWQTDYRYKLNDLVRYGGYTYVCNTSHTSASSTAAGLEQDQSLWDIFNPGVEYKGDWSGSAVRYKLNDVVKYGGGTWICVNDHTSTASFISDEINWDRFTEGSEFEGDWNISTVYQVGDIVRYGGNQYISKTNHVGENPLVSTSDWDLYTEGFRYQNDWSISTSYKIGDVVRNHGYTYVAVTDSPSISTTATATTAVANTVTVADSTGMIVDTAIVFTGTAFGDITAGAIYYVKTIIGSTSIQISDTKGGTVKVLTNASGTMTVNTASETTNTTYWSRLNSGISWRNQWTDDTEYEVGDAVRFGANAYICINKHRSEGDDGSTIGAEGGGAANSRPDLDTTGIYWNLLSVGTETNVLTTKGDLVYFGGSGPIRLPIGLEGQVLRAGEEYPEWVTLGKVDHNYYVSSSGQDLPAPTWGLSQDKPWKTIRYACEQVEKGPRNPNTRMLLELNRAFIQREVVEWVDYQITNDIAPFTTAFDYDEHKCERDVGFIVDSLVYDLGHGGNVKMRGAANSYVGGLSESETEPYGVGLGNEDSESVAALNYMLSVAEAVLNQEAPAVNYQVLNGDNSTSIVSQHFNSDIQAESGSLETITSLVEIVTDAITAGTATGIPERYSPNNLINVATGVYREVLPIIVPEQTCVLGDELRSTNAGPGTGTTNLADAKYSIGALGRMETVLGEIILGTDVTESPGNTQVQSADWPLSTSLVGTDLSRLVRTIQQNIDFRLNSNILASYTLPTGYNSSYLSGYGDARTLIKENRDFVKAEIIAYISTNYPEVKYSRTKCKRDVGYIIDALIYDLTYGGNSQSVNAALAYFDGPGSTFAGIFGDNSAEVSATIASYQRMKTVLQQIAANTTVTKTSGNAAVQWTDSVNLTGGSSASAFIGANIDLVINVLTAGSTTGAPSVTVTSITGSNTAVTGSAHGLNAGDTFTPRSTANGFVSGTKYWVLTAPSGTEFTVATTFGGSTHTLTNGTGLSIVGDVVDTPPATNSVTSTTALITAAQTLDAAQETIVTNTTAFIAANHPSLTYNSAKCERDVRLILEAVMFDFMFNSNVQTMRAGYSYLRSTASDVYSLGQKAATRAAFDYAKDQAKANVGGDTTAQARIETLMTLLDDIVFSGSTEGSRCATDDRTVDYAILQLERNRDYIVAEIDAWIDNTYSDTVTAVTAATDVLTITDTSWMQRNAAIRFSGTTFGGISAGVTYYVQNVVSSTTFKIATTRNAATALDITSDASGSMSVKLYYSSELCLRDVNAYIDAVKYDLKYPGNYKSLYASRYYANSVTGSLEEDMFYLRDATGLRDMTLEGLTGDLLAPNEYGTSRVTAGAYASLDPGWGPEDYRTWIISRSPYVQGVTTLGYAAIGQKIDGALHAGGNDSIVSNDFTQVISDGIGAWVANNGRAELVSVFTYYAHIGYLSTDGGRIRGTNGNNSYGDFGSVAEGFDVTETPGTAVVNNNAYKAVVGSVFTDGNDKILGFEFDNAGIDYTDATWTITGPGNNAAVIQDEFRDDGVFQVFLLDNVDDSSNAPEVLGNFGGFGYVTNSNTAQGGTTTQITIAATDSENSSSYVGMKVYLTGGQGGGQFGIIGTYNSGTKVATVIKESTGTAGWDHIVPGTTIVAPDASTTYTIEPRIQIDHPGFEDTLVSLPSGTWNDVIYGETSAVYTAVTGTYSGTGASGASFNVIRNGWKYIVSLNSAGTGYTRSETVTISGTSLGGLSITNDLTVTITSVNSLTGAITSFDTEGYGLGGRFVAVKSSSADGATSEDGVTWTNRASLMPSSQTWIALAHGLIEDGSTQEKVSTFVAISSGATAAAYSYDGLAWSASPGLPSASTWTGVAYGDGRFVAIAYDSTTVAISLDGLVWDITGTLPGTSYTSITYGRGLFVAVKNNSTEAATSTDGVTWTTRTLPESVEWHSVTWGNNRFVATAYDTNNGAYSLDGTTWTTMTIGSPDESSVTGWRTVKYGQGLFMATTYAAGSDDLSFVATSENGITWTIRGINASTPSNGGSSFGGWNALAFGNPQRIGRWIAIQEATGTQASSIRTGAQAKARAFVAENKIFSIRMTEPGSGYDSVPSVTITDPSEVFLAPTLARVGKGVLATPSFTNRGTGYVAADAEIDTGDGVANFLQNGTVIAMKHILGLPVPGSNVVFDHLPNETFKLVNVLTLLGTEDGAYTAFYQISPAMKLIDKIPEGTTITTRIRYSQVRLTGHDFLDIGTGNFTETNYPGLPTQDPNPANETVENNGGRVFYTSTDQDGNFRVGGLFTIEQSTGIATLNADAFNIAGLQELSLGEVTLGGGSATITEFSTDPFFTSDSDTVIPTQRAIKAYIASQIGGGGAALNVNSVTAGSIYIATTQISTTTGAQININAKTNFLNGIKGYPVVWNFYLR